MVGQAKQATNIPKGIAAALFLLLFLSATAFAVEPVCDQCFKSYLVLNLSETYQDTASPNHFATNVYARAYYYNTSILQQGRGQKGQSMPAGSGAEFTLLPATNSTIYFTFDGQPIVNASNEQMCYPSITASDDSNQKMPKGTASCFVEYYRDEITGKPVLISDRTKCGLLLVELNRSLDNARVKPYSAVVTICPTMPNGLLSIWTLFSQPIGNSSTYLSCFPAFLILGFLIAGMYYSGKNPLSLFDITTPRLPQGRPIRFARANLPYHLGHKGRMNDRVIMRSEAATEAAILRMYRNANKGNLADVKREIRNIFKKYGGNYTELHNQLDALARKSGMDPNQKLAGMRGLDWYLSIREAARIDKDRFGAARAGTPNEYNVLDKRFGRNWPSKFLGIVGPKLAKPWKIIPALNRGKWGERLDRLPGLPYVERMAMIGSNWWGNRYGQVRLRRDIRNSLVSEVGVSLGLLNRNSKFAERWGYGKKKLGEIPNIVEREHQETFVLGQALKEEALRTLMQQIYLKKREAELLGEPGDMKIDQKRLEYILALIHKIERDREAAKKRGVEYDEYGEKLREVLDYAKSLKMLNYRIAADGTVTISDNKGFFIYDGEANSKDTLWSRRLMTREELEYIINLVQQSGKILREAQDPRQGGSPLLENGRDPRLRDAAGNPLPLDPQKVAARYNQMTGLLTYDHERWRMGKIPLILIGHDISEVMGRILLRTDRRFNQSDAEDQRLSRIQMRMEDEYALRKLFMHIMDLKPYGLNRADALRAASLRDGWTSEKDGIRSVLSIAKIREDLDYKTRDEFAARHYIGAYTTDAYGYWADAAKNRIEMLRQRFGATYSDFETLFRSYQLNIARNNQIYETMKNMSVVYLGERPWNSETYSEWRKRGVLYEDIKKGVWIINADKTIRPMADLDMDAWRRTGKFVYKPEAFLHYHSEYAERHINAVLLTKDSDGKWHRFAPQKDPDVRKMAYKILEDHQELAHINPTAGGIDSTLKGRRTRESWEYNTRARSSDPSEPKTLVQQLYDRYRFASRYEFGKEGFGGTPPSIWNRASQSFAQFLERSLAGGAYNTNERLNQWYATQATVRVLLAGYSAFWDSDVPFWKRDRDKNPWLSDLSDEAQKSMEAKRKLADMRSRQLDLLSNPGLSAAERSELGGLHVQISAQERAVRDLDKAARANDRATGGGDRAIRRLADLTIPFYNINEMTVMRDPRIAFGGGYGMMPAAMVGYQTGQFVGERAGMWNLNLMPADRITGQLIKPAQTAAMAFGMLTRTFFTKMTGYTTVYNMNIESGPEMERYRMREAFQSLFRPAESFDWLTRFTPKPFRRRVSDYRDEFGLKLFEDQGFQGKRMITPFGWRGGAPDEVMIVDKSRIALDGLGAGEDDLRRRKAGLNFRDEFTLWEKRYYPNNDRSPEDALRALRGNLPLARTKQERDMISSQISELSQQLDTSRFMAKIPGIGRFFDQGYYATVNRSGYDINAIGGGHRPWELFAAYYKNMGKSPVPGMIYTTWDGELRLAPRVANALLNAPSQYDLPNAPSWQSRDIDPKGNMRKLLNVANSFAGETTGTVYPEKGAIGLNALAKEGIRDQYRHEKNALYQFMHLETERMSYGLLNSPYVMPAFPAFFAAFHILRRFHSREFPLGLRDWGMVSEDVHEKPLTAEEKAMEERSRQGRMDRAALASGLGRESYWTCGVHGVSLPYGQFCPICHTAEEDFTNKQKRFAGPKRIFESAVMDTVKSYMYSFLPFNYGGYNYYVNQTFCPTHGVGYPRGQMCPMCRDPQLLASRGLAECPIHHVQFEQAKSCYRCTGRAITDLERVQDSRPPYRSRRGMEAYKEQLQRDMDDIAKFEKEHRRKMDLG